MNVNHGGTDNVALIRSRVRLFDVVSKKIKLTKRGGGNSYIGLCPFHSEKTPSFNVNCDNDLFYCFGCGVSGDVIQFVSDTEGLDFRQAMIQLAQAYGVELYSSANNSEAFDSIGTIMEHAAHWAVEQLKNYKPAQAYLKNRGINDNTIKRFRLGYIPSSGLKAYLLSSKISVDEIRDAGLLSKSGQDCLYNRVIFPICNHIGRVISFGGRSISSDHIPKYLNAAENALFRKRESLYGLHLAMGSARKSGRTIVVEGYMDVLILSQLGMHNVVGVLGTAMTESHLKNIWSTSSEIIIWMDGDTAGFNASVKIAQLAISVIGPGQSIRFVQAEEGRDPYDICISKSLEEVKGFIEDAKLLSEFIWEYEKSCVGVSSTARPEQCMMLEMRMKEYTSKIKDIRVSKYFRSFFDQQIKSIQNLRRRLDDKNYSRRGSEEDRSISYDHLKNVSLKVCEEENYQIRILHVIVDCPGLLDDPVIFEQFASIDFSNSDRKLLQQNIVDIKGMHDNSMSKEDLLEKLQSRGNTVGEILKTVQGDKNSMGGALFTEITESEMAKVEWQKLMLSKQLREIHAQIIELRLEGKDDIALNLSEHAREIDEKLRNLWFC